MHPETQPAQRLIALLTATLCLVLVPGTIHADDSDTPALTPHDRVERLTTPEACACWYYHLWDPAMPGPPQPPRTTWEDEPLEQVYASMIASLRLPPQLADLLHYFLIEEMTEEERAIVVTARVRPIFEEYLDRWVINIAILQDARFFDVCGFLVGDADEGLFRYNAERICRSAPRSIAHNAFSLRTGALHFFRNLDRAWETPVQQEARRQQDAIIALVERMTKESPRVRGLPDDLREAVLNKGVDDAQRRMTAWFNDPFQFLAHQPLLPGEFDEFMNETERVFDELLESNLKEQENEHAVGIPGAEGLSDGMLRAVARQRAFVYSRIPARVGSTIMHHYVSSPKRKWNPSDERLFPLGAPSSIGTTSRTSASYQYPPVKTRPTLLPRDGLQIVLQHPEVLAGNDLPDHDDHTSRIRAIVLPDPSLKAYWCEARFPHGGSHPAAYLSFTTQDFLDGRRNPRESNNVD